MAAEILSAKGIAVTIYERMPTAGRKFLMAGRGGLNLTHSEPLEKFLTRYGTAADVLAPLMDEFSPTDMRAWCEELGQETFIGSSGRVFPKVMKASPLLRAWLARLQNAGVVIIYGKAGLALIWFLRKQMDHPAQSNLPLHCSHSVALHGLGWGLTGHGSIF